VKIPKQGHIQWELEQIKKFLIQEDLEETEVRLQVYENGNWKVRYGDPSFDVDHLGYWGCSLVSTKDTKSDLTKTAVYLIEQVENDFYCIEN
jgi:hypothetical protein